MNDLWIPNLIPKSLFKNIMADAAERATVKRERAALVARHLAELKAFDATVAAKRAAAKEKRDREDKTTSLTMSDEESTTKKLLELDPEDDEDDEDFDPTAQSEDDEDDDDDDDEDEEEEDEDSHDDGDVDPAVAGSKCKACNKYVGTDCEFCMTEHCDMIFCTRTECIEKFEDKRETLHDCVVCSKRSCYTHLLDSYCRDCEKYGDIYQCCDLKGSSGRTCIGYLCNMHWDSNVAREKSNSGLEQLLSSCEQSSGYEQSRKRPRYGYGGY